MSVSSRREYSTSARNEYRSGSGVSAQTLAIASAASATAAFAVSHLWGPGTLLSAAATPVIVSLVSEALKRPVRTVAASARKAPTVRSVPVGPRRPRAGQSAAAAGRASGGQARPHRPADRRLGHGGRPAREESPILTEASRHRRRRVLLTAIAAFAIVVALYTVSDALAGHSVTGNGDKTTFFGGSTKPSTSSTPPTTSPPISTTTGGHSAPSTPTQTTTPTTPHPTTTTTSPNTTSSSTATSPPSSSTPTPEGNSAGITGAH